MKDDSADLLGGNAHRNRTTRNIFACWPALLDLRTAASYLSVGTRTIEDWIHDGLLMPVPMPGSTLKGKAGNVIARASRRRIAKILIAREDLDALIDQRKESA